MLHKQAVLFLIITVQLLLGQSQWIVEDDLCRTPSKKIGTCIAIHKCAPIMEFLQSASTSNKKLPQSTIDTLKSYQCGYSENSAKVCCSNEPSPFVNPAPPPKPGPVPTPPNVSRHRNLNKLPYDCGFSDAAERITNGEKTSLFEFPWMALIKYQEGNGNVDFKCAGTVINGRYILTAAHCITNLGNVRMLGVRVGEYNLSSEVDCETVSGQRNKICSPPVQDVAIERIIAHPLYNAHETSNDIGLLRLSKALDTSKENVKPVCLPTSNNLRNKNFVGKKLLVTGWGRTETGRKSDDLLKVSIPVVPLADCQKVYQESHAKITVKQICAGGKDKKDSCRGDSGGPLQKVENLNSDARHVQYGVVSFGTRFCGQEGVPAVYTRVDFYLDWILDNLTA